MIVSTSIEHDSDDGHEADDGHDDNDVACLFMDWLQQVYIRALHRMQSTVAPQR